MDKANKLSVIFLDAATFDRGDVSFDRFKADWDCEFHDFTAPDELAPRIAGKTVAVTNKVVFDAAALASPEAAALKLIAVAATGYNNIDLDAARGRGLAVCNVAGYSTLAVAQHTFASILELASCTGRFTLDVRSGAWEKSRSFSMLTRQVVELAGRTLGIIGFGQIGREVEKIALAFGMKTIVYDPLAPPRPDFVSLDEILRRSDVITIHCPLTPETRGLIDARAFSLMRPTAFLINAARGGIVDEPALITALHEKRIAGAAMDVLTVEPPPPGHPMAEATRELDNLIITPHTAWSALEARRRLLHEIAENIAAFERGESRNRIV